MSRDASLESNAQSNAGPDAAAAARAGELALHAAGLRRIFVGRRFLHFGGPLAVLLREAKSLAALGAERPFLLGDTRGTGAQPAREFAETAELGVVGPPGDIVAGMNASDAALSALPESVRTAVNRWDPDGEARAVCWISLHARAEVAGRPVFAPRRPEWNALEDKVRVDALWDAAGVERAPAEIVEAADAEALRRARAAMDRGAGTVWAGDAREGVHGGAQSTFPVVDEGSAAEAFRVLSARCDRVRVMPLLRGIPCSVHGIVLPGETLALRPVELLVLRKRRGGFLYAGCATTWDPPAAVRATMRETARRTGEHLRRAHGFLGAFTVDGIATAEGFLPTELNPRAGAGLNCFAASVPSLPLQPLIWAAAEGIEAVPGRGASLERALVESADALRSGWAATILPAPVNEERAVDLVFEGGAFRRAEAGESRDGRLAWGPAVAGSFLRLQPEPSLFAPGRSFAPVAAAVFDAGRRILGAPVPEADPAEESLSRDSGVRG